MERPHWLVRLPGGDDLVEAFCAAFGNGAIRLERPGAPVRLVARRIDEAQPSSNRACEVPALLIRAGHLQAEVVAALGSPRPALDLD